MSDTLRTDEFYSSDYGGLHPAHARFARQLERELTAAKTELTEYKAANQEIRLERQHAEQRAEKAEAELGAAKKEAEYYYRRTTDGAKQLCAAESSLRSAREALAFELSENEALKPGTTVYEFQKFTASQELRLRAALAKAKGGAE